MKIIKLLISVILLVGCSFTESIIEDKGKDDSVNVEKDIKEKDLLILVNKENPLSEDYDPGENEIARKNLLLLIEEMKNLNFDVSDYYSGYRSYNYQKTLYEDYVKEHGKEKANTFSAQPGYSEHQTGLTFDLFHNDGQLLHYEPEASWLSENAHHYGFIMRYQQSFESITGYIAEPWHIRYVGEHAKKINDLGITLEEYLDIKKSID